jgi:hypothetical protein
VDGRLTQRFRADAHPTCDRAWVGICTQRKVGINESVQARTRRGCGLGTALEAFTQALAEPVYERQQDLELAREVVVQKPRAQAGCGRDRLRGRTLVAVLSHHLQ